MANNRTKHIKDWKTLVKFAESINPYKKTIVLTGFLNKVVGNTLVIDTLIFSTHSVQVLKDEKTKGKGK